jgi:hypothetical protein
MPRGRMSGNVGEAASASFAFQTFVEPMAGAGVRQPSDSGVALVLADARKERHGLC